MCRRLGFVLQLVLLFALSAASQLKADSIQQPLVFQSLDQSIWGPGGTPASSDHRFFLINPNSVQWNASSAGYPAYDGGFWEEDTYLFGEAEFGAGGRARSSGSIGLWVDLKLEDLGSVDVTYPVTPRIEFPDANSFRAGDEVDIRVTASNDTGWSMSTTSPQFQLEMDASLRFAADAGARLCVFDCLDVAPVPALSFDTGEFNIFTIRPGSSLETPPWLDFPLSGRIAVPNIQTTAHTDGSGNLSSTGSDAFLSLTLDVAGIAFDAARSPVSPSFDTNDYPGFDVSGVGFHYNIIKVEPTVTLTARQNFHFDPDLKVTLRFQKPLEIVSGALTTPSGPVTEIDVRVPGTLRVRYPSADKQPTPVTPQFRLDNTFTSATGFGLDETLHVSAGAIGLHIPSLEIWPEIDWGIFGTSPGVYTPSVDESVGPLYSHDRRLAAQDLGNIFNDSWQLGGFAPIAVDVFALDPENPIVLLDQQTGATRNLGGGHRQVAYAIDFSNGGDVKLSDVHLVADLASAFAAAHSFHVDRVIGCDVATNPDFNGVSNTQLLAAGTALDVGAKGRVILLVSVWPKPDPPVYTLTSVDDGTSPLGTFVTKTDSSDVLLGPGVIKTVDDYVLFGEHFVKLDAIASTFGHVGSNDFVEVKNGNSAIVAGDLRAGRTIKVQGAITADYAYAGRNIDVVQKAALHLSGNRKVPAALPVYAVPAPASLPPLQGNVWVADQQSQHLQPGHYGDVTVNAGATLTLAPGTYSFATLAVGNGATVRVAGSTRGAVVNVLDDDDVRIGQNARFRGILRAPLANVFFEERSRLEGAAAARSITLRSGASAHHHIDCDTLVDPDCDGSPSCGQF